MSLLRRAVFVLCLLALLPEIVSAAPPVVFSRQVLPLLRARCWNCHSGPNPTSGYSLETRDKMLAGGRHGAAIIIGKGKDSSLIRYLTGELKPIMPPNNPLDMDQIALLRRWIDEGANVDSYTYTPAKPVVTVPMKTRPGKKPISAKLQPSPQNTTRSLTVPAVTPVTALAFSPDGKTLAVAGYKCVRLLDSTGNPFRILAGPSHQVQCLAFSPDGKTLAAGGGLPGENGEVVLFDFSTGKPRRTLGEHTEVVTSVAFKPNAAEIATASLDKTIKIWDAATGKLLRNLKDHADAVFSVAYSPDGKYLATASGDRTVKLFDASNYQRVATLNAHQDAVTRVVFSPDGKTIATASADKTLRIWDLKIGSMENPRHTQGAGDLITDCAFSPDGQLLLFSSADRIVRAFNGEGNQHRRDLKDSEDWVYAVAISREGNTVAAGTQDGKVLLWEPKDWKLLKTVNLGAENHGGHGDKREKP